MRLALIDDSGQVVGAVEGIEGYDLDKPMAVAAVIDDVKSMVGRAASDGQPESGQRPAVWAVPLRMVESRRYREESCSTLAVEAPTAEEAVALVKRSLAGGEDQFDWVGVLDWDQIESDAVGADIVEGPDVDEDGAVLPSDEAPDLRAADFETAAV